MAQAPGTAHLRKSLIPRTPRITTLAPGMQLELWPDHPQVTQQEVRDWVSTAGIEPDSWRARYYVQHWHVAEKIAEIKRRELKKLLRTSTQRVRLVPSNVLTTCAPKNTDREQHSPTARRSANHEDHPSRDQPKLDKEFDHRYPVLPERDLRIPTTTASLQVPEQRRVGMGAKIPK